MSDVKLPLQIQGLIWTKKIENIDLEKDKALIIHHVLRHGRVEDISWLLRAYPHDKIRQIFLNSPLNIYSRSSLHFAKNTILNISEDLADESRYIQSFS
jgi:hypothetical protein